MVNLEVTGSVAQTFYNLFYYAVILLAVVLVFGFIGLVAYYYLQATKFDVEVYIKRRGVPEFKKDRLRFLKTDKGEIAKLVKTKRLLHPEKIKPYIKFVEGKRKPVLYLYTEDMREFYPCDEEVYRIEKEIEVEDEKGKKKKVRVEGVSLGTIVSIDDRMIRLYGYEELKMSQERSKIENPFKGLIEVGKYAMVGVFILLGFMIITNSIKDFSNKMVEITQENQKFVNEMLSKTNYVYNVTEHLLETQKDYVREMRRMSESISDLVLQVRQEQEYFREWMEKQDTEKPFYHFVGGVNVTNTTR